jgi:hypothetical protein
MHLKDSDDGDLYILTVGNSYVCITYTDYIDCTFCEYSPGIKYVAITSLLLSKVKLSCYCHVDTKGERSSCYSFLTLTLGGGELSASHLGHTLLPGKDPPVPTG